MTPPTGTPELAEAASAWPTGHIVVADLPCGQCEYNLRTAAADGRCPECGHSVLASLTLLPRPAETAILLRNIVISRLAPVAVLVAYLWPALLGRCALVVAVAEVWLMGVPFELYRTCEAGDSRSRRGPTLTAFLLSVLTVLVLGYLAGSAYTVSWWDHRHVYVLILKVAIFFGVIRDLNFTTVSRAMALRARNLHLERAFRWLFWLYLAGVCLCGAAWSADLPKGNQYLTIPLLFGAEIMLPPMVTGLWVLLVGCVCVAPVAYVLNLVRLWQLANVIGAATPEWRDATVPAHPAPTRHSAAGDTPRDHTSAPSEAATSSSPAAAAAP